ncbi:TlpA family protein disulfide reductase [Pseudoalteromonas sp. T1lg65]|uniref:TlpA family protein disulfide reductase n=1 Tax=Pseudoalteromonas sp. T1lg65 TaxID=2077101 RepID=UPI003F7962C9
MLKLLFQAIIVLFVFIAVSSYQERNLLDDNGLISAPSFILPQLNETEMALFHSKQLAGNQSVIYFFAPWCSVCRVSMPNLDRLYRQQKVNAVAIALDFNSTEEVTNFVADLQLSMPILLGNQHVRKQYKIAAYPTYYVLDEHLNVTERAVGYSSELGLRARL